MDGVTVKVDETLVGTVKYVDKQTVYTFLGLSVRGSVVTLFGGANVLSLAEVQVFTQGKIY